jgi:hypothetical protein
MGPAPVKNTLREAGTDAHETFQTLFYKQSPVFPRSHTTVAFSSQTNARLQTYGRPCNSPPISISRIKNEFRIQPVLIFSHPTLVSPEPKSLPHSHPTAPLQERPTRTGPPSPGPCGAPLVCAGARAPRIAPCQASPECSARVIAVPHPLRIPDSLLTPPCLCVDLSGASSCVRLCVSSVRPPR